METVAAAEDDAEAQNKAGIALAALGKFVEAAARFRGAIAARPRFARAYNNLGIVLAECGRCAEAAEAFKAALTYEPALAEACNNLGNIFLGQGNADEALAYFRQAVRLRPDHAESHTYLGRALLDLGRVEEAVACFNEALRLKPGCGETHNNLAIARQYQGRLTEAAVSCERALALAPKGSVYLTLSQIRRFSAGDPQLAAMERLVASGEPMRRDDRIALHYALGKAYDDCGQTDRAFAHFLEGSASKRGTLAYNEAATLGIMRRMEHMFTAEVMQDLHGQGVDSAAPVFILGMPRTGSTLLEQILASHPRVFGRGERPDFGTLAGQLVLRDGAADGVAGLPEGALQELGRAYLAGLANVPAGATRFTDKMPGNFLYAGLIHVVFPNATIIHTRRSAEDTCLSCFTQLFRSGHWYSFELGELGRYYRGYRRLMAHWRNVLPGSAMLDVDYESLVSAPEREVARILAHCGLEWSDACLDFQKSARAVQTASATQVREKLHARSVGRWRRYGEALRPLLAELEAEENS